MAPAGPLQDHALQTVVVVEVGMHGRHRQVVMVAGARSGARRGRARGGYRHGTGWPRSNRRRRGLPGRFQVAAQQVANRLETVAVAAFGDQRVEFARQVLVQGKW